MENRKCSKPPTSLDWSGGLSLWHARVSGRFCRQTLLPPVSEPILRSKSNIPQDSGSTSHHNHHTCIEYKIGWRMLKAILFLSQAQDLMVFWVLSKANRCPSASVLRNRRGSSPAVRLALWKCCGPRLSDTTSRSQWRHPGNARRTISLEWEHLTLLNHLQNILDVVWPILGAIEDSVFFPHCTLMYSKRIILSTWISKMGQPETQWILDSSFSPSIKKTW